MSSPLEFTDRFVSRHIGPDAAEQAEMARTLSEEEFLAEMGVRQGRGEDPETAAFFEQAAAKAQLWAGLTRYWQKRA